MLASALIALVFALVVLRILSMHQAHVRALTDQIVLLKASPAMVASTVGWEPEGDTYISPTNDEAMAEDESA